MRKIIRCSLILFGFLIVPVVNAGAEELKEVEEGIYQVVEDEEQSYIGSGDDNESTVYESSSGLDNGEVDNSGSGDQQTGQEGDNNSYAESSETVEQSDASSSADVLDKLEIIDKHTLELNETLFKLLISIWVLAGLFVGIKLIKEMFGYG